MTIVSINRNVVIPYTCKTIIFINKTVVAFSANIVSNFIVQMINNFYRKSIGSFILCSLILRCSGNLTFLLPFFLGNVFFSSNVFFQEFEQPSMYYSFRTFEIFVCIFFLILSLNFGKNYGFMLKPPF